MQGSNRNNEHAGNDLFLYQQKYQWAPQCVCNSHHTPIFAWNQSYFEMKTDLPKINN